MNYGEFEIEAHLEQLRCEARTQHLLSHSRVSLRRWIASELIALARLIEP
jgi:hypothetical protein